MAKTVTVAGRGEIGYDVASLDVGIHTEMPQIPGFAEHALGAKPLDTYTARWRDFLAAATAGEVAPEVAVIGGRGRRGRAGAGDGPCAAARRRRGGPGGADRGGRGDRRATTPRRRLRLRAALAGYGVVIHTRAEVDPDRARRRGACRRQPRARAVHRRHRRRVAHGWLADSPLPVTDDGFVRVDSHLRVEGHWDLFAVGDCAHMTHAPRPKAGVYRGALGPGAAATTCARC